MISRRKKTGFRFSGVDDELRAIASGPRRGPMRCTGTRRICKRVSLKTKHRSAIHSQRSQLLSTPSDTEASVGASAMFFKAWKHKR